MERQGFWAQLNKPVMALAPLANVTDVVFRKLFAKYGKPDVMFTEFVSTEALNSPGKEQAMMDLAYEEDQRPIVAQIFGADPEKFLITAQLINKLGFDGIDINTGCPDKNVCKQGAGSALIKDHTLFAEIMAATKEGSGGLPVSVKTRIGWNKNEIEEWLPAILQTKPAAITIHARTRKEMSKVPARWDVLARAVEIRDAFDNSENKPLIIGNGDVQSLAEAHQKVKEYGVDGVMIGRGIFGNPYFFNPDKQELSKEEKLALLLEHTFLFMEYFGQTKHFDIMKKHFKAYVNGFDGAKELRVKLMAAKDAQEIKNIVKQEVPEQFSILYKSHA